METKIAYYRGLASTVLRALDHPTSNLTDLYTFLDLGLTYGPSEQWPRQLTSGWAAAKIPDTMGNWPCTNSFMRLAQCCHDYLKETDPDSTSQEKSSV